MAALFHRGMRYNRRCPAGAYVDLTIARRGRARHSPAERALVLRLQDVHLLRINARARRLVSELWTLMTRRCKQCAPDRGTSTRTSKSGRSHTGPGRNYHGDIHFHVARVPGRAR
jgi:hypothetical protein